MAKKHKHEDHLNHEAWAIPYGDLVTLLLALFVVMYSMSAINEGKFRVASASLKEAFSGKPTSPRPFEIGPGAPAGEPKPSVLPGTPPRPPLRGSGISLRKMLAGPEAQRVEQDAGQAELASQRERRQLAQMADEVHTAMGDLIAQKLVVVRRYEQWLEVEIQTDLLFASGSAQLGSAAGEVLDRLAEVLGEFDNHLRIEGHTDNVPISTREFPSNWELSSARAASVVHRFMAHGVDPHRMAVLGLAEYVPAVENVDEASRNRNRRVVIVVLANPTTQKMPIIPAMATAPAESVSSTADAPATGEALRSDLEPSATEPTPVESAPQRLAAASLATAGGRAEP